jgi:hypothetical protein
MLAIGFAITNTVLQHSEPNRQQAVVAAVVPWCCLSVPSCVPLSAWYCALHDGMPVRDESPAYAHTVAAAAHIAAAAAVQARVIASWYSSSAGAQQLGFAKLWLFDNALGDAAAAALAPLIGAAGTACLSC